MSWKDFARSVGETIKEADKKMSESQRNADGSAKRCPKCNGSGTKNNPNYRPGSGDDLWVACPRCGGNGHV